MIHDYLPISRRDMSLRGWKQCDFVYVCGDAYVDHPSFGLSLIHIYGGDISSFLHPLVAEEVRKKYGTQNIDKKE